MIPLHRPRLEELRNAIVQWAKSLGFWEAMQKAIKLWKANSMDIPSLREKVQSISINCGKSEGKKNLLKRGLQLMQFLPA